MNHNLAGTRALTVLEHSPLGGYQTGRSAIGGATRVVGYTGALAPGSPVAREVLQPWVTRSLQFNGLRDLSTILRLGLLRFLWLRLADLELAQMVWQNGTSAWTRHADVSKS